jgi:NAD(P)-dependent dehydrogenase (short-subunit alcohol dehydrogenase family)
MNESIFVTGGASGLGRSVALQFARQGFRVCIGDVNAERGSAVEKELRGITPDAMYLHCDVTRIEDLEAVRDQMLKRWGRVDLVVNNAGVGGASGPIEAVELEHWQSTVDINLMGVVRGCKVFTAVFKNQGRGYFINIASGGGYLNAPFLATYNTTKAGVISLSETLAAEFHGEDIGVSVVCPGFFHTNLTESMHSKFEGLEEKVNQMMVENKVTADLVAEKIYRAYRKRQFLVLPHTTERLLWHFKRLWPRGFAMLMKRYGRQLFDL